MSRKQLEAELRKLESDRLENSVREATSDELEKRIATLRELRENSLSKVELKEELDQLRGDLEKLKGEVRNGLEYARDAIDSDIAEVYRTIYHPLIRYLGWNDKKREQFVNEDEFPFSQYCKLTGNSSRFSSEPSK